MQSALFLRLSKFSDICDLKKQQSAEVRYRKTNFCYDFYSVVRAVEFNLSKSIVENQYNIK